MKGTGPFLGASVAAAVAWSLGAAAVVTAGACSVASDEAAADTGSVEIVATASEALTVSDVKRITVTVTGTGISGSLSGTLALSGGVWRGTIPNIPIGTGRTFHADAFNATTGGTKIYTGDATGVTIEKNVTATVMIHMAGTTAPTTFGNSPPIIDAFTASAGTVVPGATVNLAVTDHDPDGNPLTTAWTATGGTLGVAKAVTGGQTNTWRAPAATGPQTITVRVTDSRGVFQAVSVTIDVEASVPTGSTQVATTFNTWPTVSNVSASNDRLPAAGSTTTLSVTASDADGDALGYSWSAVGGCTGSFDSASAPSPTFTLGALPQTSGCALMVTVTDGRGGTNTGQLTLQTGPAVTANAAPVVDVSTQSQTSADEGDDVVFRVTAHDPEGKSPLTFAWATSGTLTGLGTPSSTSTSSEVHWVVPSCPESPSLTATVTDPDGAVAKYTFLLTYTGSCE